MLGRPFSYDPRAIPSEGFTSWVFLLLLVPAEWAGADPLVAAVLLNLVALGGAAWVVGRLYGHGGGGASPWRAVAALLFLARAGADANVRGVLGLGLESMLNGLALLWLVDAALAAELARDDRRAGAAQRRFFWAALLAVGVRPENAAVGLALALVLLAGADRARALLRSAAPAAAALLLWLAWKFWLFGDLLPTAFYRKVEPGSPRALQYLLGFGARNGAELLLAALLVATAWLPLRAAPRSLRPVFRSVATACLVTTAIFFNIEPLVGYEHRFLVLPLLVLALVPALAGTWLLERVAAWLGWGAGGRPHARFGPALALALAGAAAVLLVLREPPAEGLRARARRAAGQNAYLGIGSALRRALPEPERVTVVFGDAGGIPYQLGSIFIDPNGLTEPPIARLFWLRDEAEKRRRFARYVLAQDPDLVVIGYGAAAADGVLALRAFRHSPFREPNLHFPRALVARGFRYACSLRSHADLHLGLRPGSPRHREMRRAVAALCGGPQGYRLPALILENGAERVRFARLRAPASPGPARAGARARSGL